MTRVDCTGLHSIQNLEDLQNLEDFQNLQDLQVQELVYKLKGGKQSVPPNMVAQRFSKNDRLLRVVSLMTSALWMAEAVFTIFFVMSFLNVITVVTFYESVANMTTQNTNQTVSKAMELTPVPNTNTLKLMKCLSFVDFIFSTFIVVRMAMIYFRHKLVKKVLVRVCVILLLSIFLNAVMYTMLNANEDAPYLEILKLVFQIKYLASMLVFSLFLPLTYVTLKEFERSKKVWTTHALPSVLYSYMGNTGTNGQCPSYK